ncbi:MAG TPA: hypothetical protein VL442_01130 [Mucilaginibacter sp.]|jgi:hypothetical protein|nr:hypothetical protein [Mucilaginibacter sp.]
MQLATSTSQNHTIMRRRKNVWYSVKDGNWSDPNTWMSNALDKKLIYTPQSGDDVYINHIVSFDGAITTTTSINNLFVAGKLTATSGSKNSCCKWQFTGYWIFRFYRSGRFCIKLKRDI